MKFPTFFTDVGCCGLSCCNPSGQWNYYTFTDRYCKVSSKSGLYLRWMLQLSTTRRKNHQTPTFSLLWLLSIINMENRSIIFYFLSTRKACACFAGAPMPARAQFGFFTPTLAQFFFQWGNNNFITFQHTVFWSSRYPICDTVFIYVFICFESTNQRLVAQLQGVSRLRLAPTLVMRAVHLWLVPFQGPYTLTVDVRICVCSHVSQCRCVRGII